MAEKVLRVQVRGILYDACGAEQCTEKIITRSQYSFQISPLLENSYLCTLEALEISLHKMGHSSMGALLEASAVQLERAWSSNVHSCNEETEIWTKLLNPAPYTSAGVTWFSKLKCQCCGCSTAVSFPCLLDTPGFLKTFPKRGKDHEKHALNCTEFLIFLGSVLKGAFDIEKPSSPTLNPLSFLRGETVDSLL